MRYTGRVTGICVIGLFISVLMIQETNLIHGSFSYLLFGVIAFPVLWLLGGKYDTARFFAEKDTLTQIYNRRFVGEIFPKLTAIIERRNEKLSISVVDVDNFKMINDSYGHDIGDQVLQTISKTLLNNARKSDVIVRWGGDEFVVIAPKADYAGTDLMFARFENSLKESTKNLPIDISLSIGTAVFPDDSKVFSELIDIADTNMYRNKTSKKMKVRGDIS